MAVQYFEWKTSHMWIIRVLVAVITIIHLCSATGLVFRSFDRTAMGYEQCILLHYVGVLIALRLTTDCCNKKIWRDWLVKIRIVIHIQSKMQVFRCLWELLFHHHTLIWWVKWRHPLFRPLALGKRVRGSKNDEKSPGSCWFLATFIFIIMGVTFI